MNRHALILSLVVVFGMTPPPRALATTRVSNTSGAAQSARAFYRYHFSHGKCYDVTCLKSRRRWLTAELYSLLMYERRREVPRDEAPYLVGDPFTYSQDTPHTFRIGKSERDARGAKVEVFVYWLEDQRVVVQRTYSLIMVVQSGRWKIADILNHNGGSLRNELKELKRKDG